MSISRWKRIIWFSVCYVLFGRIAAAIGSTAAFQLMIQYLKQIIQ